MNQTLSTNGAGQQGEAPIGGGADGSKTMKRFQVIMPIAVSAKDEKEAIAKVRAMLTDGVYQDKFIKYSPIPNAADPTVIELPF